MSPLAFLVAALLGAGTLNAALDLKLNGDPAAVGLDAAHLSKVRPRLQALVGQGRSPGMVTLLARDGQVISVEAIGHQDREAGIAMRPDTIFQIQSITKPITCAGIMLLVDDGQLSLLDPVDRYIPEFKDVRVAAAQTPTESPAAAPAAGSAPLRPVTLYDLMTHTAGMNDGPPRGVRRSEFTLAELVSAAAREPLRFEPGSKWAYSSMGIATLGRVIEVASGERYEAFLQRRIFDPLKMADTHFYIPAEKESRLAVVYRLEEGKLVPHRGDRFRRGAKGPSPDAGLYSTAHDVARFLQMMLNGGALGDVRILSPAAVDSMTRNHTGSMPAGFFPGSGFGLGWAVVRDPIGTFRYNSVGTFGHGGGWRSYGWVDPSRKLVGVILTQFDQRHGDRSDEVNAFMAIANASVR